MFDEFFLDVYPFTGNEQVLEISKSKSGLKRAIEKRANKYQWQSDLNHENIQRADLIIFFFVNQDDLYNLNRAFWEKIPKGINFLFFCYNKLNIHFFCDILEGETHTKNGINCVKIRRRFPKNLMVHSYYAFQSFEELKFISHEQFKLENYLISRTGRSEGRRKLRKVISVFAEILFIKILKWRSLAPCFIFVGKLC